MDRTPIKSLLCASLLVVGLAMPAKAVVLFTDNFDATGPGSPNTQTTNPGRQGGTLATLGYIERGNIQIGNTGTLPPSPGSDRGDEMLAATSGEAVINHDFSTETVPLQISWTGIITSIVTGSTTDDWTTLVIGAGAGAPYVNNSAVDSVLIRASGGTQIFDHGVATTGPSGTGAGLDVWAQYSVVLSDLAGTGGAFGTGGSKITYYINGTLIGSSTLNQLHSGEGYFGFTANHINGYDNVTVQTIPETSSAMTGLAGLASLALLRRRK